jgi:hypothetical protein
LQAELEKAMRYPTQDEEGMMRAALSDAARRALKVGAGSGSFHGFEFLVERIDRPVSRRRPFDMVRVTIRQDGECSTGLYEVEDES